MPGQPWWVIEADIGGGLSPTYQVVQGPKPNPSLVQTASGTTVKVTGPYKTQAEAEAVIPKGARTGPGVPTNTGPTNIGQSLLTLPSDLVPQQVTQFFSALGQKATWERVGEVVVGLLVLYIGLKALITPSGQDPAKFSVVKAVAKRTPVRFVRKDVL